MLDILIDCLQKVLIAIAVGALIGLKIERGRERFLAGVRTHAIISLLGMLSGRLMILSNSALVLYAFTIPVLSISITIFLHGFRVIFPVQVRLRLPLSMVLVFYLGVFVGIEQYSLASSVAIALTFAILEKERIKEVLRDVFRYVD